MVICATIMYKIFCSFSRNRHVRLDSRCFHHVCLYESDSLTKMSRNKRHCPCTTSPRPNLYRIATVSVTMTRRCADEIAFNPHNNTRCGVWYISLCSPRRTSLVRPICRWSCRPLFRRNNQSDRLLHDDCVTTDKLTNQQRCFRVGRRCPLTGIIRPRASSIRPPVMAFLDVQKTRVAP